MKQAKALTELLIQKISEKFSNSISEEPKFYLAISGGSGPKNLFHLWSDDYIEQIPWERIELFWVDERCVSPLDDQSNYGLAKKQLLDFLPLPEEQVHRIKGEDNPAAESVRYSKLVTEMLPVRNSIPIFDFIVLGIGNDGHTSSIFPGQNHLYNYKLPYAQSVNPHNGQNRIAMTGLPIIEAWMAAYYLTGESKAKIIDIISKNDGDAAFPAGYLMKYGKNSRIFWDR
ncbi:MAG: 6-phosphogluconolactonase [Rikenellaceae bacterium]